MKIGLNLSIDVTKIDKAHLIEGKKGKYLNQVAFVNLSEFDQYGNHGMITQGLSKEARDAGEKGAILGNLDVFWADGIEVPRQQKQSAPPVPQQAFQQQEEDIPF